MPLANCQITPAALDSVKGGRLSISSRKSPRGKYSIVINIDSSFSNHPCERTKKGSYYIRHITIVSTADQLCMGPVRYETKKKVVKGDILLTHCLEKKAVASSSFRKSQTWRPVVLFLISFTARKVHGGIGSSRPESVIISANVSSRTTPNVPCPIDLCSICHVSSNMVICSDDRPW